MPPFLLRLLVLFLLLLLAACAAQPTALLPTATSTPAPTRTPTLTPSPTAAPTPTPLPHPAAFDAAFARGLIRYDAENGRWLVAAVQTVDGGRQTVELVLLPDSFDTHNDLRAKNPLAPYTLRALDENGQQVTLLWNAEKAEFRLAYTFPALFEGIGAENPRLIEENLDQIPFIPIEDIQSGLAAQSVLLAMQEDGYQPFGEEATTAYAKLGGYSLLFELKNGYKTADLKSWVNWTWSKDYPNNGKGVNYNTLSMKVSPYWIRTELNGQTYDVPVLVLLNPRDAKNPDPSEFLVVFGIPHGADLITLSSITKHPANFYRFKGFIPNRIELYAQRQDRAPLDPNSPNLVESLLAQLLSIEGNDASDLGHQDGYLNMQVSFTYIDSLGTGEGKLGNVLEMPVPKDTPLPPQLQQMIFLFEVGVAQ